MRTTGELESSLTYFDPIFSWELQKEKVETSRLEQNTVSHEKRNRRNNFIKKSEDSPGDPFFAPFVARVLRRAFAEEWSAQEKKTTKKTMH